MRRADGLHKHVRVAPARRAEMMHVMMTVVECHWNEECREASSHVQVSAESFIACVRR